MALIPGADTHDMAALRDENEQLRTALEASLDENTRLVEDRDRLTRRVTMLAQELRLIDHAPPDILSSTEPNENIAELKQSQAEEELRVAFEELQVLAEELELANSNLLRSNEELEGRVQARTRDLTNSNGELRRTELRLSTLIEGVPQLVWRAVDGGQWTWCSSQWSKFTGQPCEESLDWGWAKVLHPDDREIAEYAWSKAEEVGGVNFEARICEHANGRYRYFKIRALPVRGVDGAVLEWLGTSTDIDDIKQLQDRQSVLVSELQHRTRNLMAVVQAVTRRTVKGSRSLDDFQRCIDERMAALSRVQSLLSRRDVFRVSLEELLIEELSAHVDIDADGNGAQVTLAGPSGVPLESSLVQTFALAVHELSTNAVKYGALSTADGRLAISWTVEPGSGATQRLHLEWLETGVTDLPKAGDRAKGGGYGRELIERALPYQLGAKTSYGFTDDGIRCTIDVDVPKDRTRRETNHARSVA